MKLTKYGLKISIEELEKIFADAKNQNQYHDREDYIYINEYEITQPSKWCECFPYRHCVI